MKVLNYYQVEMWRVLCGSQCGLFTKPSVWSLTVEKEKQVRLL